MHTRWQEDGEEGEVNRDRKDNQFFPKTKGETSYKVRQCYIYLVLEIEYVYVMPIHVK